MNLSIQKRIASKILRCGESRIWMDPAAQEKIGRAITRKDVRGLIKDGLIKKLPEKKSPGHRERAVQKAKGRRSGPGSRKGDIGARVRKKDKWLKIVRPQRALLKSLKRERKLLGGYGTLYKQIKGGIFRSKRHMISHLEEHRLANVSLSEFDVAEKARKSKIKSEKKKNYERVL